MGEGILSEQEVIKRYKEEESERLRNLDESHFFSDYDHDALMYYLYKGIYKGKFKKLFSDGISFKNRENIDKIKDEQFFAFGNHKSHMDYLLAGRLFLENLEPDKFPHVIAGKSLNVPLLPYIIGFDYKKANVCWFDRSSKNHCYINEWSNRVKEKLEAGKNFMVYSQGTRTFEDDSGHKFKGKGIAKTILDANCDPYILTLTVDYDQIIEGSQKEGIYRARDRMKNNPQTILEKIIHTAAKTEYYVRDALAFLERGYYNNTGAAYLTVGEPKRLSEIINLNQNNIVSLRDFVENSIETDFKKLRSRFGA